MRKTLFQIIEPHQQESFIEEAYDIFMILAIIVSLIPLTSKSHSGIFIWLDLITTIIFISNNNVLRSASSLLFYNSAYNFQYIDKILSHDSDISSESTRAKLHILFQIVFFL